MIVRGIDVGTQRSHFADVELTEGGYKVVRFGEWRPSLPRVDAIFIEYPSPRYYGRANTSTIVKVCWAATNIALYEQPYCETIRLVKYDEWAGEGKSRSAVDSVFLKLVSGARRKGKRILIGDDTTNEHVRDAALIAIYGINHLKR